MADFLAPEATGVWLDIIGERLGVVRPITASAPDAFFRFSEADDTSPSDQARMGSTNPSEHDGLPFYSTNLEELERGPIDSEWYRDILKARALALRGNGGRGAILDAARVLFRERMFWVAVGGNVSDNDFGNATDFAPPLGQRFFRDDDVSFPLDRGNVWVAVDDDPPLTTFPAASDFDPANGRSSTVASGNTITIPAFTGNRRIAIAVPYDGTLVGARVRVDGTDTNPDDWFAGSGAIPTPVTGAIGGTSVRMWATVSAVRATDLRNSENVVTEPGFSGATLAVEVERSRSFAIAVPETDVLDSAWGDRFSHVQMTPLGATTTIDGVDANVWTIRSGPGAVLTAGDSGGRLGWFESASIGSVDPAPVGGVNEIARGAGGDDRYIVGGGNIAFSANPPSSLSVNGVSYSLSRRNPSIATEYVSAGGVPAVPVGQKSYVQVEYSDGSYAWPGGVSGLSGLPITVRTSPKISETPSSGTAAITVTDNRPGLDVILAPIEKEVLGLDAGITYTVTVSAPSG